MVISLLYCLIIILFFSFMNDTLLPPTTSLHVHFPVTTKTQNVSELTSCICISNVAWRHQAKKVKSNRCIGTGTAQWWLRYKSLTRSLQLKVKLQVMRCFVAYGIGQVFQWLFIFTSSCLFYLISILLMLTKHQLKGKHYYSE